MAERPVVEEGTVAQSSGAGAGAGRRPLGRAPGNETLLTTEQRHQHEDSMKNTPLTCTCTESSSGEVRTYRHTRTHTYVRTHMYTHAHTHIGRGTDQAQQETHLAPRHMHTWLDRQGRVPSPLAAPDDVWARVEHGAQNCLPEGLRFRFLWVPLGHLGAGAGSWRKISVLLSTRLHLGPPGRRHHSWMYPRRTGLGGTPHYNPFRVVAPSSHTIRSESPCH